MTLSLSVSRSVSVCLSVSLSGEGRAVAQAFSACEQIYRFETARLGGLRERVDSVEIHVLDTDSVEIHVLDTDVENAKKMWARVRGHTQTLPIIWRQPHAESPSGSASAGTVPGVITPGQPRGPNVGDLH
jgi:hypothetical protein